MAPSGDDNGAIVIESTPVDKKFCALTDGGQMCGCPFFQLWYSLTGAALLPSLAWRTT
jgi:hypothetical protein